MWTHFTLWHYYRWCMINMSAPPKVQFISNLPTFLSPLPLSIFGCFIGENKWKETSSVILDKARVLFVLVIFAYVKRNVWSFSWRILSQLSDIEIKTQWERVLWEQPRSHHLNVKQLVKQELIAPNKCYPNGTNKTSHRAFPHRTCENKVL